ncbi:MAG TPA: hypothetical protein VM165_02665 [Planctomycetaceae bacterium]|nr:hypothetical protein [Planctomycetaceae bacterium]
MTKRSSKAEKEHPIMVRDEVERGMGNVAKHRLSPRRPGGSNPPLHGRFDSHPSSAPRGRLSQRKFRRQQHGSAWHWKQTDCWYYTLPGTKQRVSLLDEHPSRPGAPFARYQDAPVAGVSPARPPPTLWPLLVLAEIFCCVPELFLTA